MPKKLPRVSPPPAERAARDDAIELVIRRRPLVLCVLACGVLGAVTLFLLDYFVNYGRLTELGPIRRLFNTTREDALASWFMISLTLITALVAWLSFVTVLRMGASRWRTLCWLVLALFLTYMCADDGAKIHERLGSAAADAQAQEDGGDEDETVLDAFPSYDWQVVLGPFFAAMGLFILGFLWFELGDWTGRLLLVAALGLFALAVGLDFIEGLDRAHRWNLYRIINERYVLDEFCLTRFRRPAFDSLRHFSKSLEENIEISGMTLLLAAILRSWMRQGDRVVVKFVGGAGPRRL